MACSSVARYFAAEQSAIEQREAKRDAISRQMEEMDEEHGGEEGLLNEAKNDKGKLTKASVKARQVIAALGGTSNIQRVDACAETRLRLVVGNEGSVDEGALQAAGVTGVMRLANHTLHLIVGLNADQYAAEMQGQLAGP